MLNLFILIILDQYEINYFNSDNPLNKFQEYENMFIESWSKFAKEDKGMKMHQQLLVPLMLQMEKPIGYDLKQKIQNEIAEWKRINPQLDNKETVQKYTLQLKAQAKRIVSTQLMKMNIYSDNNGHVKYHQILFCVMKSYMWKKVQVNLSPEGAEKILLKEEETQKRLKKKQVQQSKEVSLVNPIVQFLFVHMAFKTLKRYGEKKKQQKELQQLIEQEQEHYSGGFSSDSSFDNKIEILSRNSKDTEYPRRPDYGKPKFISLPNTEIYKEDEYINKGIPVQNDSNRNSEEEEENPDEDVMQQYTKDFQKHLIHNVGSNGNIQDDRSGGGATKSSLSRQSQINRQQKKLTLKPNDLLSGMSKKSIQSISQTNNLNAIYDNPLQ